MESLKIYKQRNSLCDNDEFGSSTEDGLEDERRVRGTTGEAVVLTQEAC